MNHNQTEQIAELKALRLHYRRIEKDADADVFEFVGPKVPSATDDNPTRFAILCDRHDLRVTVTLPGDYPSQSPPIFEVTAANNCCLPNITSAHEDAIKELLDEQATYMPGMACIQVCLLVLDDLDLASLDLGQPGRCRSIFKVDVVNNSKQFTKSLKNAANGNPCAYYYRYKLWCKLSGNECRWMLAVRRSFQPDVELQSL